MGTIGWIAGALLISALCAWGQPTRPAEEWSAFFDESLDIASAVDAVPGTIAVAGNRGIILYNENGSQRAVIPTDTPQTAVRILGDRVFAGGETGVSCYGVNGEFLWFASLENGCDDIESASSGGILAQSGGVLFSIDPSGNVSSGPFVYGGTTAFDTLGAAVFSASGRTITRLDGGSKSWTRDAPFSIVDLDADEEESVWIVGATSVARLSGATGATMWVRSLPGTPTAVCTMPGDVVGEISIVWPDSAVVTGYQDTARGRDIFTVHVSSNGEIVWQVVHDSGAGDDCANDVVVASNGDVLITGHCPSPEDDEGMDDYLTIRYTLEPVELGTLAGVSAPQSPQGSALVPPVADFEFAPERPLTFEWVDFQNESFDADGFIVSQHWTFGPFHEAKTVDATHSYLESGAYDVTLTVTDNDGLTASVTKPIPVENRPPMAAWSAEAAGGGEGLRADFVWTTRREEHGDYPAGYSPEGETTDIDDVDFEDRSSGGAALDAVFGATAHDRDGIVARYLWDFGDGTQATGPSPSHTYASPGTYDVTLTVVDNEGARTTATKEVSIGGSGAIVARTWSMGGPGSFQDGTSASSEDPTYWFSDNSGEGPFSVSLTIEDASGATDTATKWIDVRNVSPTADFDWSFSRPFDWLPDADDYFWSGEGGDDYVVAAPSIPTNAGMASFNDLSFDAEPTGSIESRDWDFDGSSSCESGGEEGCTGTPTPDVVFTWGGEGGDTLFRGTREVTLTVWDDDGEGGPFGASTITQNVQVANIPPYAGFEWWTDPWNSWTSTDCSGGDDFISDSDGPFTVTREITNWSSWEAVFMPWDSYGEVALTFEGSGTVQVSETVPSGWSIDYWGEDLSVVGDTLTGEIDISEGSYTVYYQLECPSDGTATQGTEQVSGTFINEVSGEGGPETYAVLLDSDVVLCLTVDADTEVDFYAFDDGRAESGYVDPNGDSVDFDWDFGTHGTDSGDEVYLYPSFNDLTAQYEEGDWIWEASIDAELTVTDSPGASTSVSTTVDVWGYCSGGGGE